MGGVGTNMNWLESIVYGLISGISEFLPISSHAHQQLLLQLFGVEQRDPFFDLVVHLAMLLSVYSGCRTTIEHLRRDQKIGARAGNMRNSRARLDLRLVKNAAVPMLVGLLVLAYIFKGSNNLLLTAVFFFINGLFLYIPERMLHANKDARSMSLLDSLLIGISGALSAFPGISRVGSATSVAYARGADRQNALTWALLLSIPALIALMGIDVLQMITNIGAVNFWGSFFCYILAAAGTYAGGYFSIMLMRFLTVRTGFSGFAYYSWGAALFTFILYLTVV